jgi:GNAT superfamily N-acetyltransferase
MTTTMRIARADPTHEHLATVLRLIDEASAWLRTKGTDQWAKPWPDKDSRDARVLKGLKVGRTWIVWDGRTPAATVTIATHPNAAVWSKPECDLSDRAVYAHRLITSRDYAGWGLGAKLINWVGLRGRREYGAKWIRIDVWTSNRALHGYYMRRGFEPCGHCADPAYPSGALFQKRVAERTELDTPLFTSHDDAAPGEAESASRGNGPTWLLRAKRLGALF